MDQYIFLRILRMIVVMTREYKKCYNASLLIYGDNELKVITAQSLSLFQFFFCNTV